jgi:hypothetical protein
MLLVVARQIPVSRCNIQRWGGGDWVRVFSRPQQSKTKFVGQVLINFCAKLLKIRYALFVHLGSKAHLPLRAIAVIFL